MRGPPRAAAGGDYPGFVLASSLLPAESAALSERRTRGDLYAYRTGSDDPDEALATAQFVIEQAREPAPLRVRAVALSDGSTRVWWYDRGVRHGRHFAPGAPAAWATSEIRRELGDRSFALEYAEA